jgi:hypothetical protein
VPEAFADRGYAADGTLVPRSRPGALLTGTPAVVDRALRLAGSGELVAVDPGRGRARQGGARRAGAGRRAAHALRGLGDASH